MKRGSGHTAYPSRLLIRLSRAMMERVKRSAANKGQTASVYVRGDKEALLLMLATEGGWADR